jgi:hypothetical protein
VSAKEEAALALVERFAGYRTYREAIAEAEAQGDDDLPRLAHEEFMIGLEEDWDMVVLAAREIADGGAR